jgi:hypothetical protein
MNTRFKTKDGWLTPYALECGYVEQKDVGEVSTTLWKYAGCSGYHVRSHDHDNGVRLFWEVFETLTEARKCFKRARK